MKKIIIQNKKIAVTISENRFNEISKNFSQKTHFHPDGKIQRIETPEQQARQSILSDAMRKLGNRTELRLITDEYKRPHDPDDVMRLAKRSLMVEYLTEHGKYNIDSTMMRLDGGHRMSDGMANDVYNAEVFADGLLSPISGDDILNYMVGDSLDSRADQAISDSIKCLDYMRDLDLRYRTRLSNNLLGDVEIEILSEMPSQIGMCRYQEAI